MTVKLPAVIKQEIAKLPDAARDVVAQRLRDPPSPPVIYESAVRQLAQVRDIDTTKRVLLAADGLALWGKLHEDNRAIFEAQKLKAHALRQMFICARMLGEPYEVLQEKKVWHSKARRAEELASFTDKCEIDSVADDLTSQAAAKGLNGRPEFLVGRIADQSPLARATKRDNERRWRESEATARAAEQDPKQQFKANVLDRLARVRYELQCVEQWSLEVSSIANKKLVREHVVEITEALDRIDSACAPSRRQKR